MNLAMMTSAKVAPGHIQDALSCRFDSVEVVEANRDGWYDMLCIQSYEEQDARIRLRVRFIWSSALGGWMYRILPGDRA
jgi:hypothetical protein